jgi:hypothetical protein
MKKVILLSTFLCLLSTPAFAQSVDILWQGDSYTPPFYEGRALWSTQSKITFVAMPQSLGSASALNYKWTKNGTVLGNISGVGKNSLSFVDSILSKPQVVKVEVVSADGTVLAGSSVYVTNINPSLAIYENNPLYGFVFNREISGTYKLLSNKEVTFTAFPLFFGTLDRFDEALKYQWRSNVGDLESKGSVTYRSPDNANGSSEVQAKVTNTDKISQTGSTSFLIQFENPNTNL